MVYQSVSHNQRVSWDFTGTSPHPVTWLAPGPAESSMLKRNVFLEPKKSTVMDLEREIEDFSEAKMGRSGDLAQAKMRIH